MDANAAYDVIVVGGGPGGSTAAALLHKYGRKALLLEKQKFPRDKVCGDAISGKSVSTLKELGLLPKMESLGQEKITGVTFSGPDGTSVDVNFPLERFERSEIHAAGYTCRRLVYDHMLFENAKSLVDTIERFEVKDFIWDNGYVAGVKGVNLDSKEEKEFRAKVVMACDGATSILAKKAGVGDVDPKHHCTATRVYYKNVKGMTNNIEIHFVDTLIPGYFWIFPMADNTANVGVGMVTADMAKLKVNLKDATFDIVKNHPVFKQRFEGAQQLDELRAWNLPFGSHHRKPYGNGFVLCGDAASLIDPFSGEGIGNAMLSGSTAAKVIDEALKEGDVSEKKLKQYDERLWAEIGGELKASYNLQKLGKHKFLLNFVIRKAKKSQKVRETISAMLGNPEALRGMSSPLFYVKLLFT